MAPFQPTSSFYGVPEFLSARQGLVAAQAAGRYCARAGALLNCFALLMPLVTCVVGLAFSLLLSCRRGTRCCFHGAPAPAPPTSPFQRPWRLTVPKANPSLYIQTGAGGPTSFNIIGGDSALHGLDQQVIPQVLNADGHACDH